MPFLRSAFATLLALSSAAAATPIPPSEDPWYTCDNYTDAKPGDVLKVREKADLSAMLSGTSAAYQIMYASRDSQDSASWAVTTLFVPTSPANNSALLSYLLDYDSADIDYSPSYSLYGYLDPSEATIQLTQLQLSAAEGWYINVPDHEGPKASFTAGRVAGHATLDSVRAVLSYQFSNVDKVNSALWGYSGGSIPAEFAVEMAADYAPELSFDGACIGGVVPKIWNTFSACTGTIWAGLLPAGIVGLASQYDDVLSYIQAKLKTNGTYNATTFLETENLSLSENLAAFAYQNIYNYFDDGISDLETTEVQKIIYSDGTMGHTGVPKMPLFVYKAIADEVSPINDTDVLVAEGCAAGVSITYERNTIGGHRAGQYNGMQAAMAWLAQVLSGSFTASKGCSTTNTSYNVTDSAMRKRASLF